MTRVLSPKESQEWDELESRMFFSMHPEAIEVVREGIRDYFKSWEEEENGNEEERGEVD